MQHAEPTRARTSRPFAVAITIVMLGAIALASCGRSSSASGAGNEGTASRANKNVVESDDAAVRGGKLVYALTTETNGWNPATDQWAPSGLIVARQLFDTVTAYDEHSEIKPFAA